MSDKADKLIAVSTFGFLVLAVALMLSPTGLVGSRVSKWWKARAAAESVRRSWPGLDSVAQRPHGGTDSLRLIEFADYECPYCRASEAAVSAWSAKHPAEVIALVHLPLPIHPGAEGAARAAICAADVGKGPEMHQLLMTTTAWQGDTNWRAVGQSVGIGDLDRFTGCLHSQRTSERLKRSAQLASTLGVSGTPTFVSQDGRAVGEQTVEALEALESR